MEDHDIKLKSEEMQELMGEVPPVIIKTGVIILSIFTIIVFMLSILLKYPEQIKIRCMYDQADITTSNNDIYKIKYTGFVSLEQKNKIKTNMPTFVQIGNNRIKGKIKTLSNSYDKESGLFKIEAEIYIPCYYMAEIIQYKNDTNLYINVSDKSILKKILHSL